MTPAAALVALLLTASGLVQATEPSDALAGERLRLSKASRILEQATARVDRSTDPVLQASHPSFTQA